MKHTRFYTAILLGMMVLNIAKYQLPYIEYNLFKNYIAENLCVKKNEANNCCQGKCFLEKQIGLLNEADEQSANSTEEKQVNNNGIDDFVVKKTILQEPVPFIEIQLSFFRDIHLPNISLDITVPPPQRFI
jgi:hypothetical protein